jgi:hypothetical protein
MRRLRLNESEWNVFVARYWRTRPYSKYGVGVIISERQLFQIVVTASNAARKGDGAGMRLYCGSEQEKDLQLLPRAADGSFVNWRRRVRSVRAGQSVSLVASALQQFSYDLWLRTSVMLRGLLRRVEIPPYGVAVGAFVGDYEFTPFGIHRDAVEVMMSVIRGHKRIRVWSPGALDEGTKARYRELVRHSRVLSAARGDLAAWSSSHWHIGESSGLSVSLNIALGVNGGTPTQANPQGTQARYVAAAIKDVLKANGYGGPVPMPMPPADGVVRGVLPILRSSVDAVSRLTADVERRLLASQLERMSGFGAVPPPRLATVIEAKWTSAIRMRSKEAPVLRAWLGDWIIVGAAGHSWIGQHGHALELVIKAIPHRRATPQSVEAIVRHGIGSHQRLECASEVADLARSMIVWLCRTGVIEICDRLRMRTGHTSTASASRHGLSGT